MTKDNVSTDNTMNGKSPDMPFQGNDQFKDNAMQMFKALNQNREVTIESRTV